MKIGFGGVRLEDISGGTLGAGIIPYTRILSDLVTGKNASQVVVTATDTEILAPSLTSLALNEMILLIVQFLGQKGVTGDDVAIQLSRKISSVADVDWFHDKTSLYLSYLRGPSSNVHGQTVLAVGKVTNAGDLDLSISGVSLTTDFTIAAGEAQFVLWRLAAS